MPLNSKLRMQNYLFEYIEELNYLLSTTSGLVIILARGYCRVVTEDSS